MTDFFQMISVYPFMQRALIASVLCSIAFGITGPFVVKKRLTFLAGGIAHAVMGGIGAAYFFNIDTSVGAIAAAVIFSLIISLSRSEKRGSEDTLVSTLWAAGMSIGVIFIYLTPGYNADLASFIFGNILMVRQADLFIMIILDITILILVITFYYHFIYLSFDEDFLKLRSKKTKLIYFLLLLLISITVVITIKIVGLILVIALVTLPSVIASLFTRTMRSLFISAVIVGCILTVSGLLTAYSLNIPASASIILLSSTVYFSALLVKKAIRR